MADFSDKVKWTLGGCFKLIFYAIAIALAIAAAS